MAKKWPATALWLVLGFGSCFGQQIGVTQDQLDAIRQSLQRIAVANNAVESAIYDGMTYSEVLRILRVRGLDITSTSIDGYRTMSFVSYVGNYLIHWSDAIGNPVVVGYSRRGETTVRHNELQ